MRLGAMASPALRAPGRRPRPALSAAGDPVRPRDGVLRRTQGYSNTDSER